MVKRSILAFIQLNALLALVLAGLPAQAASLSVEPDKTRLHQGEVLTLTVKGTTRIDVNLSNLFEFDLSSLPAPDIEKAEADFDILARNQRYSLRTVNGNMVGDITWTYRLAPRTTGKLTIPALTFQGAESRALTIEVVDSPPPAQNGAPRDAFIELTTDKAEAYVQEQIILTVSLFFRGNLVRGELSDPEHPHALIEPLGKQQESSRTRDGVHYRVVERRYAVFPQKTGTLSLPALRFEGQARNQDGSLAFLRDSATLFDIPVKDVPADFSGSTWLPATELTLSETGMPGTLALNTGDNLTRTLSLKATGLPAEALPPLPEAVPDGLRSYPEAPEREASAGSAGITSTLTQTRALVPVQAGGLRLPAIRIPWWDTDTDSEKVAIIPAQTLNVAAAKGSPPASRNEPSGQDSQGSAAATRQGGPNPNTLPPGMPGRFWQWVSFALAAIWLLTMLAWWWTRTVATTGAHPEEPLRQRNEKALFGQLLIAAQEGRVSAPGLFVRWANEYLPGLDAGSVGDVFRTHPQPELQAELDKLQAHLFSRSASPADNQATVHEGKNTGWDGSSLVRALKQTRDTLGQMTRENALPPLYPGHLALSGRD